MRATKVWNASIKDDGEERYMFGHRLASTASLRLYIAAFSLKRG